MTEPRSRATNGVVVVTGAGGMGAAVARRLGQGTTLLLADFSPAVLRDASELLGTAGYDVHTCAVDVSDVAAVAALTDRVEELGPLRTLVHTAGLSPTMADAERILEVDLIGTAIVVGQFERLVQPGTVGVVVASMAAAGASLTAGAEQALATGSIDDLRIAAKQAGLTSPGEAYCYAKRGNQLRVQAAAAKWGRRGGRIVSISPGIIATGMGRQELDSEMSGPLMRALLESSPVPRFGTAEDIAASVDWIAGPAASFITGVDLLVDGGVTAAGRFPA